jgi:YbbR domain-containing protein
MLSFIAAEDRMTLLACFFISFMIWVVTTLSEEYPKDILVSVQYINLPEDKALIEPLPDKLYVSAVAKGTALIKHTNISPKTIVIDYKQHVFNDELRPESQKTHFETQLDGFVIKDINPSIVHFKLEKKAKKVVPIEFMADVEMVQHFYQSEAPIIMPDSMLVVGPASIVDTLKSWKTEALTLREVNKDYKGDIALQKPKLESLQLSFERVNYWIKVVEFTEKRISVPISILHLPKNMNIFPYPQKVNVKFQVSIDEFDEINESHFTVVSDFSKIDVTQGEKLKVELLDTPPDIKNLTFSPQEIEYLIIN